jgi:hypothetical protein
MSQLSLDVISHYIITVQGNHYPITSDKEKKLQFASGSDMFMTQEGVQVKVSNIAEILPKQKYFETYPQKQTDAHQPYTETKTMSWDEIINSASSVSHIEAMIRGFKKSNKNPNHSLLKRMEVRLRELNEPKNTITNNA